MDVGFGAHSGAELGAQGEQVLGEQTHAEPRADHMVEELVQRARLLKASETHVRLREAPTNASVLSDERVGREEKRP